MPLTPSWPVQQCCSKPVISAGHGQTARCGAGQGRRHRGADVFLCCFCLETPPAARAGDGERREEDGGREKLRPGWKPRELQLHGPATILQVLLGWIPPFLTISCYLCTSQGIPCGFQQSPHVFWCRGKASAASLTRGRLDVPLGPWQGSFWARHQSCQSRGREKGGGQILQGPAPRQCRGDLTHRRVPEADGS